jgi:hypothetical protein
MRATIETRPILSEIYGWFTKARHHTANRSSRGRTIAAKESGVSRCPTPFESRQADGGV